MQVPVLEAAIAIVGLLVGRLVALAVWRASMPGPGQDACDRAGCQLCASGPGPFLDRPLLARLLAWGSCEVCKETIPRRYALVHAATAAAFVAMAVRFGAVPVLPAYCVLGAALVATTATDLARRTVPRQVVHTALVSGGALLVVASAATRQWRSLEDAALGGLVGFLALLLIHMVSPRGLGFGDVRLAGLVGMFLGWLGLAEVLLGILAGFTLAAAFGLGMVVAGRRSYRSAMPFAPFIAAGTLLLVLFGIPLRSVWGG